MSESIELSKKESPNDDGEDGMAVTKATTAVSTGKEDSNTPPPKRQRTEESVEMSKKESPNDDGEDGMTVTKATTTAVSTDKDDNNAPPPKRQRTEESVQNGVVSDNNSQNHQNKQQGKKKKIKNKHMDPQILKVRRAIQEGCRTNNLVYAMKAYDGARKEGIRIEAQSYYNLLNLCGGLDREDRKLHVGTPKEHPSQPQPKKQCPPASEPKNDGDKTTSSENKDSSQADSNTIHAAADVVVIDMKQRQEYIFAIKERMQSKEVNLPLNETAYSAIVRILSKNKEFPKAEEILDEAEGVQQCKPKLRLYASLLHAYCEDEQLVNALRCWKRMRQRALALRKGKVDRNGSNTSAVWFGVDAMDVTEREYLSLLRCAVRTSARSGGEYLENGSDLVMEDVLTRLAEDIPIPAKDTVTTIAEWFEIQNNNNTAERSRGSNTSTTAGTEPEKHPSSKSQQSIVKELLSEIRSYDNVSEPSPRMGPVTIAEKTTTWTISKTCSIDRGTGILRNGCLEGCKLHRVPLSDRSFRDMTTMNKSIVQVGNIEGNANCKFQGGRKGKKRTDFSPEDRRNEWNRFEAFLEQKTRVVRNPSVDGKESTTPQPIEEEPYEVVIDGANIGYFNQNFASAPTHVDYEQIDWVVRHFTEILGKKVLLVMHHRHFIRHKLPQKYRGLYEYWIKNGILYKTPPGMNDDWFWMHAALKYKALVVTNDEMRDHQFQMLAPKFFLRWKERHQVYFNFLGRDDDKPSDDNNRITCNDNIGYSKHYRGRHPRKVILTFPNLYSRRIQRVADGLVIPLTKRGDENRFLDGCRVADDNEPEQELYLCIRPKIDASTKNTTDVKNDDNDAMMEDVKSPTE